MYFPEGNQIQIALSGNASSLAAVLVMQSGLQQAQLVRQGKPISTRLTVVLRTGTLTAQRIKVLGPVTAQIVAADALDVIPSLKNDSAELSPEGIAYFHGLQFTHGTRKRPLRLRFEVPVSLDGRKYLVTSEPSPPLIVLTNERQWPDSERQVWQLELPSPPWSWPLVANSLHYRYLKATKQRLRSPPRPLSQADLEWLRRKGGIQESATFELPQIAPLFDWFVAALFRLRFQRTLLPLWLHGLLAGFITRHEAEELLSRRQSGTFVVRFSEQVAGQLAIAYVASPFEVRHYLLAANDLTPKRTLADFLWAAPSLTRLLKRIEMTGPTTDWVEVDKTVLTQFLSRSATSFPSEQLGYDKKL